MLKKPTPLRRVALLGGTGFVGRTLAARLQREGLKTRVITRDLGHTRALWTLPDVECRAVNTDDAAAFAAALDGCDAVVNLVGILNERRDDGRGFAKAHVESLRRHIVGLSEKKYHTSDKMITPDFVILFMPIEPAFALAFKYKPDLLQYAWDMNIALVSPTTLLTTLRTVAAIWKQDRQEKNALEIAKRGGALYDKFALLVEDLDKLGTQLSNAQKAHGQVMSKLNEGSGNLIRQVEMLKELGAKAEKKLIQ